MIKKLLSKKRGFTLVELVCVIAIIAILLTIIAPNIFAYLGGATSKTKENACRKIYDAFSAKDLTDYEEGTFIPHNSGEKILVDPTNFSECYSLNVEKLTEKGYLNSKEINNLKIEVLGGCPSDEGFLDYIKIKFANDDRIYIYPDADFYAKNTNNNISKDDDSNKQELDIIHVPDAEKSGLYRGDEDEPIYTWEQMKTMKMISVTNGNLQIGNFFKNNPTNFYDKLVIDDEVRTLNNCNFGGYTRLKKIVMPSGLASITGITFPSSFYGTIDFSRLGQYLDDSSKHTLTIGENVFAGYSNDVSIPCGVVMCNFDGSKQIPKSIGYINGDIYIKNFKGSFGFTSANKITIDNLINGTDSYETIARNYYANFRYFGKNYNITMPISTEDDARTPRVLICKGIQNTSTQKNLTDLYGYSKYSTTKIIINNGQDYVYGIRNYIDEKSSDFYRSLNTSRLIVPNISEYTHLTFIERLETLTNDIDCKYLQLVIGNPFYSIAKTNVTIHESIDNGSLPLRFIYSGNETHDNENSYNMSNFDVTSPEMVTSKSYGLSKDYIEGKGNYSKMRLIYHSEIIGISFPKNLVEIPSGFLLDAKNLSTINFDNNCDVEKIKNFAFFMSPITTINISSKTRYIDDYSLFSLCGTEIDMKNVQHIGKWCLHNNKFSKIDKVKMDNVITIDEHVFDLSKFTKFILPINLVYINGSSFPANSGVPCEYGVATGNPYYECIDGVIYAKAEHDASLDLAIEQNEKNDIVNYAVKLTDGGDLYCLVRCSTNLTSCVIRKKCSIISKGAFYACIVESVTIQDSSLEKIRKEAFDSCSRLKNITIKGDLKEIEAGAFMCCSSLESIEFQGNTKESGIALTIGDRAFMNCTSLTKVVLPDTLTSLGTSCFLDCTLLREINLPNGLTNIPRMCFANCQSLRKIYCYEFGNESQAGLQHHENLESLSGLAFFGVPFKNIILNDNLKYIATGCFASAEIETFESHGFQGLYFADYNEDNSSGENNGEGGFSHAYYSNIQSIEGVMNMARNNYVADLPMVLSPIITKIDVSGTKIYTKGVGQYSGGYEGVLFGRTNCLGASVNTDVDCTLYYSNIETSDGGNIFYPESYITNIKFVPDESVGYDCEKFTIGYKLHVNNVEYPPIVWRDPIINNRPTVYYYKNDTNYDVIYGNVKGEQGGTTVKIPIIHGSTYTNDTKTYLPYYCKNAISTIKYYSDEEYDKYINNTSYSKSGESGIPSYFFAQQGNLGVIDLPSYYKYISICAFKDCSKLDINVPASVENIGLYAFQRAKKVYYTGNADDNADGDFGAKEFFNYARPQ